MPASGGKGRLMTGTIRGLTVRSAEEERKAEMIPPSHPHIRKLVELGQVSHAGLLQ